MMQMHGRHMMRGGAARSREGFTVRFFRDRTSALSFLLFVILAVAVTVIPHVTSLDMTRNYRGYSSVPPSIDMHPSDEDLPEIFRRIFLRTGIDAAVSSIVNDQVMVSLVSSSGAIPVELVQRIEQSVDFSGVRVRTASGDPARGTLIAHVERRRFVLGTDTNGRDMLARVLHAASVSMLLGLVASAGAMALGILAGTIAGYRRGMADVFLTRLTELAVAIPHMVLIILMASVFGNGFTVTAVAIIMVEWVDISRIARAEIIRISRMEYVQAARLAGMGEVATVIRHVLPGIMPVTISAATIMMPRAILAESYLSFLGLGIQEPVPSLGNLVAAGADNMQNAPWQLVVPVVALVAVTMGFRAIAEGGQRAAGN